MKNSTARYEKSRGILLVIICLALIQSGCQTLSFDPRGRTVPEAKRIALQESGESRGIYKTDDLTLTYKMARAPGKLTITGEIHFADRVIENFPVIQYFHLDAILIDAQGKVQDIVGLISASFYRSEYILLSDPPLAFNTSLTVGESTKSIAFSYTGKGIDPTERAGGSMDFWEYPVE